MVTNLLVDYYCRLVHSSEIKMQRNWLWGSFLGGYLNFFPLTQWNRFGKQSIFCISYIFVFIPCCTTIIPVYKSLLLWQTVKINYQLKKLSLLYRMRPNTRYSKFDCTIEKRGIKHIQYEELKLITVTVSHCFCSRFISARTNTRETYFYPHHNQIYVFITWNWHTRNFLK